MFKLLPICIFIFLGINAGADEGMWLLNAFPTKQVQQKYGFTATPEWLNHVQLSAARLAGGCSASFVSGNGLVMTNHHCAHSCIQQLSTSSRDYVASGFYAKRPQDEVKCPDIEVNRLVEIKDVTKQVQGATKGLEGAAFNEKQKAEMSRLEKDCTGDSDKLRCDVVSLYHGGKYQLYKYQRFQDVRLVFAPEFATAFFGGDPDNFMFPRYDMDISFLRVYEDGHPWASKDHFKWSTAPAAAGDTTFVVGHPGRTDRLMTVAQLEQERDVDIYEAIVNMSELRGLLTEFQNRGAEQKRISNGLLFGIENSLKAQKGRLEALKDPTFFARKLKEENAFRRKINANPKWKKEYGASWDRIKKAEQDYRQIHILYGQKEDFGMGSKLFRLANLFVRAAAELPKPNEKRYREFSDANLPRIRQSAFSEAPIYPELEIAMLTFDLTKMREQLTADDPFVKKVLGQKSPVELATELVKGTHLADLDVRRQLMDGGQKAIDASSDPMIKFALLIDPDARAIRKKYEDEIEPVLKRESEKIAQAHFAVEGMKSYPDATFTLRISYGQIKGYEENGRKVDPITRIQGAFDRNTGRAPFDLPASWLKAKDELNLSTPLNFCSDNDIIGGNSGSPVINKNAEIVGLIFDGNIQSLGGDFGFDDRVNRAVAVHSAGILELLRKVYGADRIVRDLTAP